MSTPDTNNPGIKLQDVGENLNTWGNPNLNNALVVLSNLSSKVNPITINGDYSFASNTSSYSTSNPDEVAVVKLIAGTVAANFNLTLSGRHKRLPLWNITGYTAQVKLAATTGFALPTGYIAMVATDGVTDVWNISPTIFASGLQVAGIISGVSDPQLNTDAANKRYVDNAVAGGAIPAASGAIKITAVDAGSGYPQTKLTASGMVAHTTVTAGDGTQTQSTTTAGYTATGSGSYIITAGATSKTAFATAYWVKFTNPNYSGAATLDDGSGAVAITKNGTQALGPYDIPANAVRPVMFDGAQFQLLTQIPVIPLAQIHAAAFAPSLSP